MRTTTIISVCLILTAVVNIAAQDVVPPPGFTPESGLAPAPSVPGFLRGSTGYQSPRPLPDQGNDATIQGDQYFDSQSPYRSYQAPQDPPYFERGATPYPPYPDVPPVVPTYAYSRFWLKAKALYWWTKSSPLTVPLVTTGGAGVIGQGGSVLIGNQDIELPGRPGGRFTLGFSPDPESNWGLEATYLFLGNANVGQGVSSDGSNQSAVLAFPFFNPTTVPINSTLPVPGEDASYIALPGSFAGRAVVNLNSFFQGAEANLVYSFSNTPALRFDMLGGFRWVNVQEVLTFTTDSPSTNGVPPFFYHTADQFSTQNNFYGGQFGARASFDNTRLFFNGTAKLALGGTVETVRTNGYTVADVFSAAGAYLTQPSNIGTQSLGRFAVVPEADLNFGIRLSPWASFTVGYSFLYVSSVARPGDQIDRVINPTQSPAILGTGALANPARPSLSVHDTDFWVQGLNFGFDLRF